jgi:Uma2 family endonuclease
MVLMAMFGNGPTASSDQNGACLAAVQSPSVAYRMVSARSKRRVTALEFLSHPAASGKSELVRGEIHVMTPAGGMHGIVAGRIFVALNAFVKEHGLGLSFPDNTGFELPGLDDTVRSPDAGFVRADRLSLDSLGLGWVPVAPDLVVEVLSPSETSLTLDEKWRDYRAAGAILMWVIDPAGRTVTVREPGAPDRQLVASDTLNGGSVLPEFSIAVAQLFSGLPPAGAN